MDDDGNCIWPTFPKAVAWCAVGALQKCYGMDRAEELKQELEAAEQIPCLITWNDAVQRKHADVLGLFKKYGV